MSVSVVEINNVAEFQCARKSRFQVTECPECRMSTVSSGTSVFNSSQANTPRMWAAQVLTIALPGAGPPVAAGGASGPGPHQAASV